MAFFVKNDGIQNRLQGWLQSLLQPLDLPKDGAVEADQYLSIRQSKGPIPFVLQPPSLPLFEPAPPMANLPPSGGDPRALLIVLGAAAVGALAKIRADIYFREAYIRQLVEMGIPPNCAEAMASHIYPSGLSQNTGVVKIPYPHSEPMASASKGEPPNPISALPTPTPTPLKEKKSRSISLGIDHPGMGVSRGAGRWVTGHPRFEPSDVKEGDILVRELTQPGEDWEAMQKAGGIVTTKGGPLSHAAVSARELGIHAVILEGATIRQNMHDEWELVVEKDGEKTRIGERDYLRVLGSDEGGGVVAIPLRDLYSAEASTQARFWLEELLFGARLHDEARSRLAELVKEGEIDAAGVKKEASVLFAESLAEMKDQWVQSRLSAKVLLEQLQEFRVAIDRLRPFLDPAETQTALAELEEKRLALEVAVVAEVTNTKTSLEDETEKLLKNSSDGSSLPDLRRLLRQLSLDSPQRAGLEERINALQRDREMRFAAQNKTIFNVSEVDAGDIPLVGGKFARLGDVLQMVKEEGLPVAVPRGIVLSKMVFERFLIAAGIREPFDKIQSEIDAILQDKGLDETQKREHLEKACQKMQELLTTTTLPPGFGDEIYAAVDPSWGSLAVRSSGILEDAKEGAYAGMARTHLNVLNLMPAVRDVWASFWEVDGVLYRHQHGQIGPPAVAVIIQKMISGETSGVMFSQDPNNPEPAVLISTVLGLGEGAVSGKVPTDRYRILENGDVQTNLAYKDRQVIAVERGEEEGTEVVAVENIQASQLTHTETQARELAEIARRLRHRFGFEVDVEFTTSGETIYLLQVRPITGKRAMAALKQSVATEKALKLLTTADQPILYFVCLGNRHRSPTMQLLMQQALAEAELGENVEVYSGGLAAIPGQEMSSEMARLINEAGVPLMYVDDFETRMVDSDLDGKVEPALLIVAEEEMKKEVMRRFPELADRLFAFNELAPHAFPGEGLDVADPAMAVNPDEIERIFDGIERGVRQDLLPLVKEALPYRRISESVAKVEEPVEEDGVAEEKVSENVVSLLQKYPDLASHFANAGWQENQRNELLATLAGAGIEGTEAIKTSIFETPFGRLMKNDFPPLIDELGQETGWDVAQQLKILKCLIHLYKAQSRYALADIELALLDKIDIVMDAKTLQFSDKQAILEHLKYAASPRDLKKVADSFATRQRFRGLQLLMEHFNVSFPLESAEANRQMQKLLADGNYKTADDLAVCTNETLKVAEEKEVREERGRRLRRVPRVLDHERKILFDEISEFYLLETFKKALEEAGRYRLSDATRDLAVELKSAFAEEEERIFNWIREYLIEAVEGELNHYQDSTDSEDKLVGHVGISLDAETFMQLATEEEIRIFFTQAEQRFEEARSEKGLGGLGGPRWAQIAEMGRKMWEPNASRVQLVDLAFHLEHNGGMAFDKRPKEIIKGQQDTALLDLKRDTLRLDVLYTAVKDRLSREKKSQIEEWLQKLKRIHDTK